MPAGASARRLASASSGVDHAPLASTRIAVPSGAAARTAASRPASSPTPTFTFRHRNPAAAAAAAASAAPARSVAPIVAFTATDRTAPAAISCDTGNPVRRPARSHSARSIAASACGSAPLGGARGEQLGVRRARVGARQHRGVAVEGSSHRGHRHAVVGLERRRLALAEVAVAEVQPHAQQLPLVHHAPGRHERRARLQPDGLDAQVRHLVSRTYESRH